MEGATRSANTDNDQPTLPAVKDETAQGQASGPMWSYDAWSGWSYDFTTGTYFDPRSGMYYSFPKGNPAAPSPAGAASWWNPWQGPNGTSPPNGVVPTLLPHAAAVTSAPGSVALAPVPPFGMPGMRPAAIGAGKAQISPVHGPAALPGMGARKREEPPVSPGDPALGGGGPAGPGAGGGAPTHPLAKVARRGGAHPPLGTVGEGGGGSRGGKSGASLASGQVQTSPLGEMRALVRLTNAVFTRDRSVARDLNRYTEEDVKRYLAGLGLQVGVAPLLHWGCPRGKYQALADMFSWILSAIHSHRGYEIVVTEEQAQECVPYKPGSPYVAADTVLHKLGLSQDRWTLPLRWSQLAMKGAWEPGHPTGDVGGKKAATSLLLDDRPPKTRLDFLRCAECCLQMAAEEDGRADLAAVMRPLQEALLAELEGKPPLPVGRGGSSGAETGAIGALAILSKAVKGGAADSNVTTIPVAGKAVVMLKGAATPALLE
mmetsp:Transcript_70064/g.222070  ORF Transcript_70064/g.222070 Transcript_70064/m.222070 type:complete len:488 (+) Transcript_70064:452-1915(+)